LTPRNFPRAASAAVFALALSACVATEQARAPATPEVAAAPEGSRAALDAKIAAHAAENGVPVELAHAVIAVESGHNPTARGRGTVGLMQIKPATARGIGYDGPAEALYDPDTNLTWGMRYLGRAHELAGGDLCGTILRYQGGHRATRMTPSASRYCARIKEKMAAG
jgi:soluble lytic murein transglycosylase-like protein